MPAISLPNPPLTDGEIVLRAWEPSDAPAVTAACQDPEIPRWTVVPHNYTERHARDFISGTATDLASGRELARAGFTREGTLRRYRRRHGVREDLVMFSMLAEEVGA